MSEQADTAKYVRCNSRELLQERTGKANPSREFTAEEAKRLAKLESIADKLKRGENVQNRMLRTWLTAEEYAEFDDEWQQQLEFRTDLKDKPTELKR